jgi:tetratricopeptide (TPR) repeat protein
MTGKPTEAARRSQALIRLADEHGWHEVAVRARIEMVYSVRFGERWKEGWELLSQLEALDPSERRRPTLLSLRSQLARRAGDLDAARAATIENRRISKELGDWTHAAGCLRVLARIADESGDLQGGLALAEMCVSELQGLGARGPEMAMALNALGRMLHASGELTRARTVWAEGLGMSQAIGFYPAAIQTNLAMLCLELGDLDEAAELASDLQLRLAADRRELIAAAALVQFGASLLGGKGQEEAIWSTVEPQLTDLMRHRDLMDLLGLLSSRARSAGLVEWAERLEGTAQRTCV